MPRYRNREYIRCRPLDGLHARSLMMGLPCGFEPLALLYRESHFVPDGLLVRAKRTGLLSHYAGGGLRSIDQRKATAALAWMAYWQEHPEEDKYARNAN